MPLFRVHGKPAKGVTKEALQALRNDHLRYHHQLAAEGKLFGAGQLGEEQGMYILICKNEAEARALVGRDPYQAQRLRDYEILPWRLNISSVVDLSMRASLNGDDPSNPRYRSPTD
ncbi:MAG: YciI family protein [Candidatus Binatia bacterium]